MITQSVKLYISFQLYADITVGGRSANDCLHSDGKVLELLLGLTPVRPINHLVQARVHDGSLFIFLKDPQDQRPHNAHWAHPSGTRESWSWKMMSSWHKVKVTLPLRSVNDLKTEVLRLFLLHHARLDRDPSAGVAVRALRVVGTHGKIVELLKVGHHRMCRGVGVDAVDH